MSEGSFESGDAAGQDDGLISAVQLQRALAHLRIASDVHHGHGLALVSVRVGLVVWCHGGRYWWRSTWDEGRHRIVYTWHPSVEPVRAAHRIALRHAQLHTSRSLPALTAEAPAETA
ncbi:hypothetical protein [Nonomuraea sp. NPDC050783]|uniref:hypothetical protein n=1 Tax=Nonomuraea sp. NPDC050783 TaxID=3154634 RepID=UPI0034664788